MCIEPALHLEGGRNGCAKVGEEDSANPACRHPDQSRMTKRNTSGVVGVRLTESIRTKNGKDYCDWRWIAFWTGCPMSGGHRLVGKKYGDEPNG